MYVTDAAGTNSVDIDMLVNQTPSPQRRPRRHLNPECTPYEYMLSFLIEHSWATDSITATEHASVTVVKNSDD